jgi:hypothetical protein
MKDKFEPYTAKPRPVKIIDAAVFSASVDQAWAKLEKNGMGCVHLKELFEQMIKDKTGCIWDEFKANLENVVKAYPEKYELERGTIHWPVNIEFGIVKDDKAFCYLRIKQPR